MKMHMESKVPTSKGSADLFSGDVWVDPIAVAKPPISNMEVGLVRFSPGARTAWHSHPRGQTLHVVAGVARMQSRGGDVIEVYPGQTVYTPPGEEHWHGATEHDFMSHLAMYEKDEHGVAAHWLEHVEDEEKRP
jgi:quercetin dioxygenase-like cupin family protein